jgi:ubiquinone/menaquinone biosynthesis C-methylase UbiE
MEHHFDPDNQGKLLNARRWEEWDPPRFLTRLELQPGQVVLDLGCGPGFWTLPLAEIVGPSGIVWALDVSQEMLDALAARNPPQQVRPVRSELPVISLPEVPDGQHPGVDWIWAAFVFHEVDPPGQLAAEMRRVTRPGGRVAVLDWRPDARSGHGPPRSRRFTAAQVGELLRAAGFRNATRIWQDEDAYLVEAGSD